MSIITVEHATKRYGDLVAVDDVSLEVADGEIFGILGRNGAGKTTLVECIEGLRRADTGTIRVAGLDPRRDRAALRQVLGAQLQQAKLPDALRVREALELYRSFYRHGADPVELADELGLGHALDTPFSKLSGGQQQRLSVALALVGHPQVAILDEVTTGLDPHARQQAWALIERIRDHGVTIVLVTHLMDEAQRLCDRIAIIDHGRIVAVDTPDGLIARTARPLIAQLRLDQPLLATTLQTPAAETSWDRHTVTVTGGPADLQAVLVELARNGRTVIGLHVEQPDLSDAFLALTAPEQTEVAA